MTTATSAPSGATPAAMEFALLQSWLASSSALQLPLHQIEGQKKPKGGEEHRLLLLQALLQQRGRWRFGSRAVPSTARRRVGLLPSPVGHPLSHHRLGTVEL